MNCLVVAATINEIKPLLELYRAKKTPGHITIDIIITGIGLTAAAYSITRQLMTKRPGMVIQAGLGGCFDKSIATGKVLAIKQDAIADQGVMESGKFKTLSDLGLVNQNQYPFSKNWLINKSSRLRNLRLQKVRAISVNEVTTSSQKIRWYKKTFDPVVESLEGAALHYVCLLEKIPFLQLRSISNYIGERDKKKWNMKTAIQNLNLELIRVLESF